MGNLSREEIIDTKYLSRETSWYRIKADDLGLNSFEKIEEKPNGWDKLPKITQEEHLHTILTLHLKKLTDEEIDLHSTSQDGSTNIDLIGIDPFNRLHLFEVKLKANLLTLQQITGYLLELSFINKELFKDKTKINYKRYGGRLNNYFDAIFTNRKCNQNTKYEGKGDYKNLAEQWKLKLNNKNRISYSNIKIYNQLTFWLIAPDIKDNLKFKERVVELRTQGIDLRLLVVDVRNSKEEGVFYIKVGREINHSFIKDINDFLAKKEINNEKADYYIRYYKLSSPSDKNLLKSGKRYKVLKEAAIRLDKKEKGIDNWTYCNACSKVFY